MARIPPLSIRAKVLLIVAGTLVAANAAATIVVRQIVYRYTVSQKISTVEILAASFIHDVKYEVDPSKEGTTQDVIAKYMTYYRNIRRISFYAPSRQVVADSDPTRIGPAEPDEDVIEALRDARPVTRVIQEQGQELGIRSVSPILQGSRITGAAVIEISFEDIKAAIAKVDQSIIVLQVLKTFVVCLAVYVLVCVGEAFVPEPPCCVVACNPLVLQKHRYIQGKLKFSGHVAGLR